MGIEQDLRDIRKEVDDILEKVDLLLMIHFSHLKGKEVRAVEGAGKARGKVKYVESGGTVRIEDEIGCGWYLPAWEVEEVRDDA